MDRLMQYLESNLNTLNDHLIEDNFQRILLIIWKNTADILYQLISNNSEVTFFKNWSLVRLGKNAILCCILEKTT